MTNGFTRAVAALRWRAWERIAAAFMAGAAFATWRARRAECAAKASAEGTRQ